MANKTLTIDVRPKSVPNGTINKWTLLNNATVFINDILTTHIDQKTNIGQLVSGIPSAFARVDLFKTAIGYVAHNNDGDSEKGNLLSYYRQLQQEWRGLIACMALDYAQIKVSRINLQYSDGKGLESTSNIYEPKGAFGNMLLKRAKLWCEQGLNETETPVPFINVIKYRGKVVGATAPESLLFTSSGYKAEAADDRPWVDKKTGKFIDPLRGSLPNDKIAALYAYVQHMLSALDNVDRYYSELPHALKPDYSAIRRELEAWKGEMVAKTVENGYDLSKAAIPPVSGEFSEPFNALFCYKDTLYGVEGIITEEAKENSVEFDPKNLLLDETARIARLRLNIKDDELERLPILVLKADIKGSRDKAYFALPLSALGLNVYGKNVGSLVGMGGNNALRSTLKAVYDPTASSDNLEVVLDITTESGKNRSFKKVYTANDEIRNKDILIWPNFISPQWNAYFMYSELPHNGTSQDYRATPFVGEMQGNYFRILVDDNQKPVLLSENGHITAPDDKVKARILVRCGDEVAANPYKYEIFRSDKPFKGVRLQAPTGVEGGYLMINYSSSIGTTLPRDMMRPGDTPTLRTVTVGVDFGSTNTSIAYSSDSKGECGFEFTNQRVSLMGNELPGKPLLPKENQIFFFQGAGQPVKSNSIKSVLTLHDPNRLPPLESHMTAKMRNEQEVVGGFPCFADNLPFVNSTDKEITLRFPNGVGDVTQVHNMKWEDNDDDKAHKSAFLRTLMLQVYAALFAEGLVPDKLRWSYPSAMMGQLLYSYYDIWKKLSKISPVLDSELKRIPLEVSTYFDSRSIGSDFDKEGFGGGSDAGAFGGADSGFGSGFGDSSGFGGDSGFGGGFDNSGFGGGFDSGFGGGFDSGFGDGFSEPAATSADKGGEKEQADLLPDNTDEPVEYKPEVLYSNATSFPSLSEAEAVANFVSVKFGREANVLNLCFDVGGSTTDISALFYLNNGNNGAITMIKQNSLRFAAQRVSQTVGNFSKFKRVLLDTCAECNIKMVGLNMGPESYNERTAQYFFDQIVNRLNDDQLESFYNRIAGECPQLMCVNLYVTGLLMYYAGEIARKLVADLMRVTDAEWTPKRKPYVRVTFAGKGARLFQWLQTVNPGAAHNYYGNQFINGFGRDDLKKMLGGFQQIVLPGHNDPDIKYEVSKGLAKGDTELQRPSVAQPAEIIGETGYELVGNDNKRRPVEFTNSITPEMMKSLGVRFNLTDKSRQSEKFLQFCGFFYQAANQLFGWSVNPQDLQRACRELNIVQYAQNMPEFREAEREARQSNRPFSFVAPIIILEGMRFYDETLLKLLR